MKSAARRPNTSPFRQLEFCFAPAQPLLLLGADSLRHHAAELLRNIGAVALATRLQVAWNSRMRTAVGRADFSRCLICLNPLLRNFGSEEVERTLRHEMAHLLAQSRCGRRRILPHGPEWQEACRELGIEGERACHNLPLVGVPLTRRFLYRCPNCGGEFPRARRIRRAIACLACCRRFAQGSYDERFRLRLVKTSSAGNFSRILSIKSPL